MLIFSIIYEKNIRLLWESPHCLKMERIPFMNMTPIIHVHIFRCLHAYKVPLFPYLLFKSLKTDHIP